MPNEEKKITDSTCKIKDGKLFVKSSALAILEGVTQRTITNYRQRGIPTEDQHWFDYAKVRKWLREQEGVIKEEEEGTGINWKQQQLIADTKIKKAKAEKEELDLKMLKNEVITITEAQKSLISFCENFKDFYTNLPDKIMLKIQSFVPKREAFGIYKDLQSTIEQTVNEYIIQLKEKKI